MSVHDILWVSLSSGEDFPPSAILAGQTERDGVVYVGRAGGEPGKINTKDGKPGSAMCNFWSHSNGKNSSCEALCSSRNHSWVSVKRGDPIPVMAVNAGSTSSDGVLYVARSSANGEAGKINTEGGNVWNFWGNDTGSKTEAELLVFDSFWWADIKEGDAIPPNAVRAGETSSDGPVWVGRFEGHAGKINANDDNMHKFWAHSIGEKKNAEVLCCDTVAKLKGLLSWVAVNRGDPIPPKAVQAGETSKDGFTYVGRHGGEAGKINTDDGCVWNFWGHHHGQKQDAEILVIGD